MGLKRMAVNGSGGSGYGGVIGGSAGSGGVFGGGGDRRDLGSPGVQRGGGGWSTGIPATKSGHWPGPATPGGLKLPRQILNVYQNWYPPVIKKSPPKSVLDVNEVIFPQRKEVEPVSHIFGIPHSLGDVVSWAGEKLFGAAPPVTQRPVPTFPMSMGYSWDQSAPEIIAESFGDAYQFSQDLNVGGVAVAGANGGTFLGCPVEESDGCEPSKKRYTITIDNATGQCIKIKRQKSRKRRRRLASLSDIKDIAALKQVLGGGKALDTWIATRGR